MNVGKQSKHKPYRLEGAWWVSLGEVIELLDYYTLDEIQILIERKTFSQKLYKAIRPYLVNRVRQEYLVPMHRDKFFFNPKNTPDGNKRKGRGDSAQDN